MNLSRFEGKKIALLGFGIENVSIAKFFVKKNINFDIRDRLSVADFNFEAQKFVRDYNIRTIVGENYLENLDSYDLIIRTPGIQYLNPEIQKAKTVGVEISSSTKLFFDLCPAKIIGVTGTKGKGTTASIIHQIVERNIQDARNNNQTNRNVFLVGNIGIAPFDIIEKVQSDDVVIFELSSFQLQDLEKSPQIAVVTNLTEDHLDYHKNRSEYLDAKSNILKFQSSDDYAVLNADYSEVEKMRDLTIASKYYYSQNGKINGGAYVDESGDVYLNLEGENQLICRQNEVSLIGRHNLENIAAAAIVAKILNVENETISNAVKDFKGLPHRLELVASIDGVEYYNDSFSTNPTPTIAAVRSFDRPTTLILGGHNKGNDFSIMTNDIEKSSVKSIILIGESADEIETALSSLKNKIEFYKTGFDFMAAISKAKEVTPAGGIVLFSPACASFDMFKDYKARGEEFKKLVNNI